MRTIETKKTAAHLSRLYGPVAEDLAKVEARLHEITLVEFPHLATLLSHILDGAGKRVRPALTLLAGKLFDYDLERLIPMATSLELLHTATLVHDDAIDHSPVRRSRPTVNRLWGEEQAVLLGDYLFAEAGCLAASTNNLRVIKLFSKTLKIISSGELDQASNAYCWRQTRDQYFKRIAQKTATLFTTSTESGAVLGNAPEPAIQQLIEYGHNLGIAFQIVDDILDFVGTEGQLGKPAGSDLEQGTVTLPLMMLLERYPTEEPVRRLLSGDGDHSGTEPVIQMVRNSPDIIRECYEYASEYSQRALASLYGLPNTPSRACLEALAHHLARRKK